MQEETIFTYKYFILIEREQYIEYYFLRRIEALFVKYCLKQLVKNDILFKTI